MLGNGMVQERHPVSVGNDGEQFPRCSGQRAVELTVRGLVPGVGPPGTFMPLPLRTNDAPGNASLQESMVCTQNVLDALVMGAAVAGILMADKQRQPTRTMMVHTRCSDNIAGSFYVNRGSGHHSVYKSGTVALKRYFPTRYDVPRTKQ